MTKLLQYFDYQINGNEKLIVMNLQYYFLD